MTTPTEFSMQKMERTKHLQMILESGSSKRLVVAGPGTGKTFTFKRIIETYPEKNYLVMTFINKLVDDLASDLGDIADVKTFHRFCKGLLHKSIGSFQIYPNLEQLICVDAHLLGLKYKGFLEQFRTLHDPCDEALFYLERCQYYGTYSFDDLVYTLFQKINSGELDVPTYDLIMIDEYQDFNPLEVELIEKLSKNSPVLVVGDDDQAVYDTRSSSPSYLRNLYSSGEYDVFELPYCSRCPKVITDTVNAIVHNAEKEGLFIDRIEKHYECFLEDKEEDNKKYPKIIHAHCTGIKTVAKYISAEIFQIPRSDFEDGKSEGYPPVLIAGPRHYLLQIYKILEKQHASIGFETPKHNESFLVEGFKYLLEDPRSNLGWRLLCAEPTARRHLKNVIVKSQHGLNLIDILDSDFVSRTNKVLDVLFAIRDDGHYEDEQYNTIKKHLGDETDLIIQHLIGDAESADEVVDEVAPEIVLTTYVGCKGLSAGHVFVTGLVNDNLPKDPNDIKDLEVSKLLVALTRTRKKCHLISNDFMIHPKEREEKLSISKFFQWIDYSKVSYKGTLKAKDFKK